MLWGLVMVQLALIVGVCILQPQFQSDLPDPDEFPKVWNATMTSLGLAEKLPFQAWVLGKKPTSAGLNGGQGIFMSAVSAFIRAAVFPESTVGFEPNSGFAENKNAWIVIGQEPPVYSSTMTLEQNEATLQEYLARVDDDTKRVEAYQAALTKTIYEKTGAGFTLSFRKSNFTRSDAEIALLRNRLQALEGKSESALGNTFAMNAFYDRASVSDFGLNMNVYRLNKKSFRKPGTNQIDRAKVFNRLRSGWVDLCNGAVRILKADERAGSLESEYSFSPNPETSCRLDAGFRITDKFRLIANMELLNTTVATSPIKIQIDRGYLQQTTETLLKNLYGAP